MTIVSTIRDRLSPSASESAPDASVPAAGNGDALPFDGFDRLDPKQVADALSGHSQIELEAIESYERSHKNRVPVLDKLRYMRGREPLAGYDALSTDEILTAIKAADLATVKKVRGYERKFRNRRGVTDEVVRVLSENRARP